MEEPRDILSALTNPAAFKLPRADGPEAHPAALNFFPDSNAAPSNRPGLFRHGELPTKRMGQMAILGSMERQFRIGRLSRPRSFCMIGNS